mmetsp:Transcript_11568/g.27143  ORF Transcript_11568/g.27143 Transcript_11568/m.27143 type:complete len:225 (-) Transcript_11568:61-735(-)
MRWTTPASFSASSSSSSSSSPAAAPAASSPSNSLARRETYSSMAALTSLSTYGPSAFDGAMTSKWPPLSRASLSAWRGSSRWKKTRLASAAAVSLAAPSWDSWPSPPSAIASRSGRDSATSCQSVSTTARRPVRARRTRDGSGSDRSASRPDAVAMGVRDGGPPRPRPPDADATAAAIVRGYKLGLLASVFDLDFPGQIETGIGRGVEPPTVYAEGRLRPSSRG